MLKVLFTDLDGTCVHYDWHTFGRVASEPTDRGLFSCTSLDGKQAALLLQLPPSTSGAQGVISVETLRLYAALRQLGVRIVVITGARLVTLLARLPFIPAADAFVCEGGGRIFYPAGSSLDCPSAAPLMEDMGWRRQQAGAAGPPGQDTVPPEQRSGGLWRFYGALKAQAPQLHVDAVSYTTAFRVKGPEDAVAAALSVLPEGLTTALNLGAADVFPLTSGKENAAAYLMQRMTVAPSDCAFLCDDDNDLGLAHLVAKAYLPGITAASVAAAVERLPERFHVATSKGVFATEEVLRLLIAQQLAVHK